MSEDIVKFLKVRSTVFFFFLYTRGISVGQDILFITISVFLEALLFAFLWKQTTCYLFVFSINSTTEIFWKINYKYTEKSSEILRYATPFRYPNAYLAEEYAKRRITIRDNFMDTGSANVSRLQARRYAGSRIRSGAIRVPRHVDHSSRSFDRIYRSIGQRQDDQLQTSFTVSRSNGIREPKSEHFFNSLFRLPYRFYLCSFFLSLSLSLALRLL